ncbi:MAG: hypothetical protein H0V56_05565 [Chthoniobacterales bacterium]|nr:hypothetical protein [Chthoniobacterales bacterium]
MRDDSNSKNNKNNGNSKANAADSALIVAEKNDVKKISANFITAIAQHRNWDRESSAKATTPA